MAEELDMGTQQLAEMAANAEANMGAETSLSQNLSVEDALDLGAAEAQATSEAVSIPSFDINNIVAPGPGDGNKNFGQPSAPPKPNISNIPSPQPSDFMSAMNQVIDSNANEIFVNRFQPKTLDEKLHPIVGPKTRYAGQDIDRFRYQEDFDPQGFNYFNPEKEKGYIEAETWGSALGKGFDSFATRFGNTFTDYFASYGRIGDALINWDWDKLKYTESEMIDANFEEYKESMRNYVFVPPEEDDDIFSKRSVSEFIGNAGFALGTFAGLGLELVADAALTFVTGGAGGVSFGATIARVGAKEAAMAGTKVAARSGLKQAVFRFTDFMADMGKGAYQFANQSTDALSAAGKVSQKANQAKGLANAGRTGSEALRSSMKEVFDIYTLNMRNIIKSKSFTELAGNIAKGTPLLGTGIRYGEKVVAGAKGGLSTGKLVGIGLQGARRMAQEFNMSSTEANFEAVTSYGTTLDMMVEQYRSDHEGQNPSAEEFVKMQDLAMKSASANYNTNLGILLVTNRLQFGTIFNKFGPSNKFMKEILQEGAGNTLGVNRVWRSSKLLGKTYEKGFFGTYGLAGKIAKDFGRKQAAYEVGKAFAKDLLRFEVTEGLQENIQEMSGAAWKYYYAGQYNGTKYTLGQAFDKGYAEQLTKQGLRTFLQGALTGSLIRPVTHTIGKATSYLNEKATERAYKDNPAENPYVKMREQLKKDINLQNDIMAQMSNKKYEDTVVNFTNQVDSTLQQSEAAAKGLQYEWQNAKDNSVLGAALAANRSGTISTFQAAIREMGKTMTNEEFEAAFGIKLSDTKYSSAAEMTDAMAKDVKKYSDTIDGIRRKLKNMPDPLMYEKGSKEQIASIIMHNAQEEAIRIVALNAMKASRASERAQKISQELLSIPGMSNSSEYALRVLANPDNFKAEAGNMMADIRLLEESLKTTDLEPAQKEKVQQQLKDKKRMLELYDKWMEFWDNRDAIAARQDSETGEIVEQQERVADTFVGVPITSGIDYYDEDNNLIKKDETVYSLDHKDIAETLREFINLRNKEYGITDQLSEQSLRDALNYIVDYIRLDQDAKDYTRSMDLLFNPEYYRQTILNLQDGRFKYEVLEFVDTLNDRLKGVIINVAVASDLEDIGEKLMLAQKLYEELSDVIINSDYYKNLVLIGIEENTGVQHSKFAQENVKKLNEIIDNKIAEMLDKYASQEVTGDVSDLEYEEFLKSKTIPRYRKSLIARKIAQKTQLTDKESEVYEAHKDEIDAIISTLTFDENADGGVNGSSKVSIAKEALVQTGEFEMAQLDAMSDNDVLNLALERNLITEKDAADSIFENQIEVISDEVYQQFQQTQEVDQTILESIARRDLENIDLTPREVEIMKVKMAEISDIQSIIEDERARTEEENAPINLPEEDNVVSEVTEQESESVDSSETKENLPKNDDQASAALDALNKLNGTGKDGTNKTENEEDPFIVTGDSEEGFDVVSRNGITLTDEKIESEEKANNLANELNNSRTDIDWSGVYLGDLSSFEDPIYKVDQMVRRGQTSLRAYNKANETTIQTLEEYYKIPEGKRNLDDIKESVLTGVPLNKIKQKRKKAARQEQEQLDLFEDTTSGFVGGPALPLQSVQDLFDRLESATTAPVSDIEAKKADIERRRQEVESYFNDNTRSTEDTKYNPDLSGEGEFALREQEEQLLQLGADRIQAHGISKGSIGQQLKYLLNILTKGLDKRGGGQLYTAPLVMPENMRAGAGAALGTGGGTAYIDGGFIILARAGVNEITSIDDIGGVLVNQAVADSLPELVNKLKQLFPNLSIDSYSNSPNVISEINSKYDAELAALEGTKLTTATKVKPEDLKINVTATTKKGGMEPVQDQDSTIEKIDEGKFIRLTKADPNDINGKYYTIDNGILRVRVNGRDFAGRPGGATQVSVKVPDAFNEQIFADKLKNISHKGEVTTPEAIDQVINDLRNAVSESTAETTTAEVRTGDNIAQIENELKEVERQINNQTTQPTSDKTYQDLFNEKWPDASGYLTAALTKFEFSKEEGKFVEGKHIFEIRPIGNGQFEYRVVSNRASQNRAYNNYDKFIKLTSEELNAPDGADTVVTVKPGILKREGDKFVIVRQAQVFNANSSTINNKVGSAPIQSTKAKTLDAKKTKLLEDLKEARLTLFNQASQQMSEKIGKFVKEEQVSEDTILDQIRKINSCFK